MSGIIRLLTDAVANQIAAGEVIQRPASAVKELMENAIDAGAMNIKLIIKDAGKGLIQVVDDGRGMSETDARLCFERHATSKIREAGDLLSIHTLGFRGEALASIAAVAQVRLKSRQESDELGTEIQIEGSKVISQQACPCPSGTSITIKNLFYNIPARRNFLKSNAAESAHILEEFFRLALANQDIAFSLNSNGKEIYKLPKANLKQRIVQIFGNVFGERIVQVETETDLIGIRGYIGKPEYAKKTRGEQYFFVNQRYIRHPFFHHAIEAAYRQLIPENHFPAYFIFFTVRPENIDVNIHPTKTEVKFLNDKLIYSILVSSVRQGLGKFSLTPSIDFDQEPGLDLGRRAPLLGVQQPQIRINPEYNPFENKTERRPDPLDSPRNRSNRDNWEKLFDENDEKRGQQAALLPEGGEQDQSSFTHNTFQLKNRYIITTVKSGMMVIDQQRAHERILFDRMENTLENKSVVTQKELFPHNVTFSSGDALLMKDMLPDIRMMGFDIDISRKASSTFVVSGVPADYAGQDIQKVMDEILENFKSSGGEVATEWHTRLVMALAKSLALKPGTSLSSEEMNKLINDLFSCKLHEYTPDGKLVLTLITLDEVAKKLK